MMHRSTARFLAFLISASTALTAAPAVAEDKDLLIQALRASGARDWPMAQQFAAQSGPISSSLISWQKLRAGQGSWPEYRDFAAAHGDWPGMALLYQRGDALLRADLPPTEVIAWFGARKPTTLAGGIALIGALKAADPAAAKVELARFWHEVPLSAPEQDRFIELYGSELGALHEARLFAMLDQGETQVARSMLARVSGPSVKLAEARIAVQAGQRGVDTLILALPAPARADAGLALDRFRWRVKAKMGDLARELMLERSTSAEALRLPAAWASLRADYARAALRAGDWALAERFAANHFLPEGGPEFSDLEWQAGYAALRQDAPARALAHFQRLAAGSNSPITLSRAFFWQARALSAAGDEAQAEAAYFRAAAHQTAYYGQLAAEHLGLPMAPELAVSGRAVDTLPEWRGTALRDNGVWQAGVWLLAAGDPQQAQRFFLHLAETADAEDIGRMARLMMEVHRPWDALRLAKAAAAKGAVYPAAYFPMTGLEDAQLGLPPELVMSIARRESEFNHTVISHAGALGLMQVMPDTARSMARKLGEPFVQAQLTQDAAYNARLGAAYLQGLRERFGTSVALTASGYNAGPGRPARWIGEFGDLRRNGDPLYWVEMIPFDETRNYVMRVAEALPIYRARIAGKPAPFVPSFDLTGGGLMPVPEQPPIRLISSQRPLMSVRALSFAASGGVLAEVLGPPVATMAIAEDDGAVQTPATQAVN